MSCHYLTHNNHTVFSAQTLVKTALEIINSSRDRIKEGDTSLSHFPAALGGNKEMAAIGIQLLDNV